MMTPKCPECDCDGEFLYCADHDLDGNPAEVKVFACTNPTCFIPVELPHVNTILYYPTQFAVINKRKFKVGFPDILFKLRDKKPTLIEYGVSRN